MLAAPLTGNSREGGSGRPPVLCGASWSSSIQCNLRTDAAAVFAALLLCQLCRSRFWLFLSYVVSFGSVVGAVWVLMQHYGERVRLWRMVGCNIATQQQAKQLPASQYYRF